jgi:hypothetical protein
VFFVHVRLFAQKHATRSGAGVRHARNAGSVGSIQLIASTQRLHDNQSFAAVADVDCRTLARPLHSEGVDMSA